MHQCNDYNRMGRTLGPHSTEIEPLYLSSRTTSTGHCAL